MMAAGFNPISTSSYVNMTIFRREWTPVSHLFPGNRWRRDPQAMLNTLRVLVEQGAVDPAETTQPEFNYETAISLFNLKTGETAVEALEYLLHQVDTSQFEELNWSLWLLSPDLTVRGQKLVISHLTRMACLLRNPFYMECTLGCLMVNIIRLSQIEEYSMEDLHEWCKGIFWGNLNRLIKARTDQQKGFDYWTVLRLSSNLFFKALGDLQVRHLNQGVQMWLLWLEECGIDNSTYLEERPDFDTMIAAYPSLLQRAPIVEKGGSLRWQVHKMIQRLLVYDFARVDLNEFHTGPVRGFSCS